MGKDRKGKNKTKTVYMKKYDQKDVNIALKEVEKWVSTRKAAEIFQVPRSTLYAKQTKKIPIEGIRGPSTYLAPKEEEKIVDWIFYCSQRGFPITKPLLLQCVQKLVIELGRQTPFKDNKPGRHWWESFRHRHPDVTPRMAQNLTMNRALATENVLKNWFNEVKEHLKKLNLLNIHSSRVFNLDESAFFLVPKADTVLARKGSKSVYKVVHGNEEESITVLFTVNAEGTMLPPMILFWYERTPANVINSLPSGWIAGNTERGWMTADSFYNYISTKFYPWLTEHNIEFPVVLYIDGHASHVTLNVSQFCKANQIELIALYPNATHILQPLDVAVFHPIKSKWKKTVDQWRIDHGAQKLKRENFAPILKQTLDLMPNLATIIKHGFQTCGLSPFSSDAVDFNVLNKKKNKVTECSEHVDQDLKDRNSEQEEAKKHFKYLESRLSRDDIHDFESAFSSGSLKISNSGNEGLFKYWLDMKTLAAENVSNNVSLSENSGLDESEALIEIVDSMPCIPIELDIDLDVSNLEVVLMPEENDENSSTLITETHINTSIICEPQQTFVEPIEADLESVEDCDQCDSFKGDKVAGSDKHNDKVFEGLNDNLPFSNQILNISVVEGSTESQNNGDERNQTDSEVLDLSTKKVANLLTQSDETIVQDTVLTEIHNRMIDKTQNVDAECTKDERRENISSPFKTALIWPAQTLKQKKKKPIKKVSTVLTSEEWQQHYLQIQQEKLRKQKEVEDRKSHREEVKKRKAEEKEAKRAVAKEKKKLEEEIKRLITKKKTLQK